MAVAKRKLCLEHVVVSVPVPKTCRGPSWMTCSNTARLSYSGGAAADVDASRAERYGDGNTNKPEIKWDDDAVAALLHREPDQENEGRAATPVGEKKRLSKLMDSFKVAEISFEETDEPPRRRRNQTRNSRAESHCSSLVTTRRNRRRKNLSVRVNESASRSSRVPCLCWTRKMTIWTMATSITSRADSGNDSVEIDRPVASSIAKVAAKLSDLGCPVGCPMAACWRTSGWKWVRLLILPRLR